MNRRQKKKKNKKEMQEILKLLIDTASSNNYDFNLNTIDDHYINFINTYTDRIKKYIPNLYIIDANINESPKSIRFDFVQEMINCIKDPSEETSTMTEYHGLVSSNDNIVD